MVRGGKYFVCPWHGCSGWAWANQGTHCTKCGTKLASKKVGSIMLQEYVERADKRVIEQIID